MQHHIIILSKFPLVGIRVLLIWLYICILFSLDVCAQSGYINYSLTSSGKVSVNIYDSKGQIVRELLHTQQQSAGAYSIPWDGKDRNGNTLANPSQYSWKLLQTPAALQADFVMSVGSHFPAGSNYGWETGLGNHVGASSVAIDETGVYVASGGGENVRTHVKMDKSLSKLIFSGWQPDVAQGYYARTVLSGKVYGLQHNGYVSFHASTEMNKLFQGVGTGSWYLGGRWDALYTGRTRPGNGDNSLMQAMDMAGYRVGTTDHLVISYKEQNLVQWRNPATGAVLDQVSVPSPLGVAVDNAGNVLAISQGKLVRFSRSNKTLTTLIASTQLDSPWRVEVDRTSGEILIAETGSGNQVKKFSSSGSLVKTYGRKGGRLFGLHVPTDFLEISDICSDNQGGFYVTETGKKAFSRLAYISSAGSLVKELAGATSWTAFGQAEPDDASVVWITLNNSCVIRAKLDLSSRSWTVHSVYNINQLADSKIHYGGSMGTGNGVWKPLVRNNTTYLCFDMHNHIKILKVDESSWQLKPSVYVAFGYDNNDYNYGAIWTDANGNGVLETAEKRRFSYFPFVRNIRVMPDFTYVFDRESEGRIATLKVREWNAAGSPVYEDKPVDFAPWPANFLKSDGWSNTYTASHFFASQGAGKPIYAAVGLGDNGWAKPNELHVLKFNADGSLAWRAGRNSKPKDYYDQGHTIQPGEIWSAFKNTVGVVKECVVAADFNGGHNARSDWSAFTYVWDKDGLFVGGLFDKPNTSIAPLTAYTQSSENGAGALIENAATGEVHYYGGAENEVRIYKITGWNNWLRLSGQVASSNTNPTPSTLRTPENPSNTVAGLDYKYYEGTWSTMPNFNALSAIKSGTVTTVNVTNRNRSDAFGFTFNGYISVPTDGEYTFYTNSDDGSRLYIGSTLVVDNDGLHGSVEKSGKIGLKAGKHAMSIQYFDNGGGDLLTASYAGPSISKQTLPSGALYRVSGSSGSAPSTTGTGLNVTYFDNLDLTGTTLSRVDATINFDWASGSPASSIGTNQFSARWEGFIKANYTEEYTFHTLSDDGIRIWVNGQQLINNWSVHSPTENSGKIRLTAGQKYSVKIEYFDDAGGAVAQLSWSSPSQSKQIIPQANLYTLSSSTARITMIADEATSEKEDISLYPNPANSQLTITIPTLNVPVEIAFIDNLSVIRKVININSNQNTTELNIDNLKAGIYFIRMRYSNKEITKKLIVQ